MTRFLEICRFEVAHHARQRATWVYAAAFVGIAFVTITNFVVGARGSVFNGPLAITGATIVASMFGLLVTAALAGDVATRDAHTRIEALVYTAPISKATYLGGRFLGVFTVNALLLATVPAALVMAGLAQRLEPAVVGPYRPMAYLGAYVVWALPNAFVTTALLFSLATLNRSAVASYGGALVLFLAVMLNEGVLAEAMGRWELATLLDPFGLVMMRALVRSWTPAQKDTLLIAVEGVLLWNRLFWMTLALAVLALTHWRFRFRHQLARRSRLAFWRHSPATEPRAAGALERQRGAIAVPHVARTFTVATRMRQTLDIACRSFRAIVTSRGALVLAIPALFVLIAGPNLMVHMGTPLLPTTAYIIDIFVNSGDVFLSMPAPFLIVVFAGELVWREREAGLGDIADATPIPDWLPFAGKFLGLAMVLVVLQALFIAAGVVMQAAMEYYDFEIGLYLRVLFGMQLAEHMLFAALALAVHVFVNQKYVGHFVVLLAYVLTIFAGGLGVEHNLLIYGSDPGWDYSDLRGFGPFLAPFVWFKLYWAAWALLLAVATTLLWVRGRERGFSARLDLARRRITRPAVGAAAMAVATIVAVGGFILYNTNVLNAYSTTLNSASRRAEYERRYSQFRTTPQPQLTGTNLRVEIYPGQRRVEIGGTFTLTNQSARPIGEIHVVTVPELSVRSLRFNRRAKPGIADEAFGHRSFKLETSLQPSETLELSFEVQVDPRGFTNSAIDPSVAANGSYFAHRTWLPAIGYQSNRELRSVGDRRAHGLPPRTGIPGLDDLAARHDMEGAERIAFEAVVGTEDGQIAVAPGTLRRSWVEGRRRYFHYATDAPIRNDYAFFSADYATHHASWRDVAIEILHHPKHTANLDRMASAAQAALEYYAKHFGPYPHRQLRFVEHPGDGNSLHASPINISYEEGFSLFNPAADARHVDFPFAVVAHEVAHQWWGNAVRPAFVEGGALVSESVSWYSALAVIEDSYGRDHLQRFLDVMRRVYLSPRARADVPLLRAHDQFTANRKGPFAMYALREYAGTESVNRALRRLFEQYGNAAPPLPTSLDLYRELKAATPEALHYLLVDLFEKNTWWELETKQVTAEQTATGTWQVTLDVKARKVVVDSGGIETEVPMDDPIEIGVYGAAAEPLAIKPLLLEMRRVRSGQQRITLTVTEKPTHAGIDPRNLLIDATTDDNIMGITSPGTATPDRQ